MERDDVGVVQRGGGARFAFEPQPAPGVRRRIRRQHLDRDIPAKSRIFRAVNLTHAARAEKLLYAVRPECRASREPRRRFGRLEHRRLAECSSLIMAGEQPIDVRAQRGIVPTGVLQVGLACATFSCQRSVKDLGNLLPTLRRHDGRSHSTSPRCGCGCARRSETRPAGRSESDPPEGGSFYALPI
jgi:hypothetical protein